VPAIQAAENVAGAECVDTADEGNLFVGEGGTGNLPGLHMPSVVATNCASATTALASSPVSDS
jgi:hypothetical protein